MSFLCLDDHVCFKNRDDFLRVVTVFDGGGGVLVALACSEAFRELFDGCSESLNCFLTVC